LASFFFETKNFKIKIDTCLPFSVGENEKNNRFLNDLEMDLIFVIVFHQGKA